MNSLKTRWRLGTAPSLTTLILTISIISSSIPLTATAAQADQEQESPTTQTMQKVGDPASTEATAEEATAEEVVKPLSAEEYEVVKSSLVERERAYFDAVFAKQRDQVETFLAADAVFLDDVAYEGRSEYLRIMAPLFDGKYQFTFEAQPDEIHVARSGEIGWTIGTAKTTFVRPGIDEKVEFSTRYMMVWTRTPEQPWTVRVYGPLVVHPTRGEAADPRSALMTAWPELGDMVGATIKLTWEPERTERAASGDMAYVVGEYHAQFLAEHQQEAGIGSYVALWGRDERGRWLSVGESYSPPQIYGD